jgi:hypothetical protein
MTPEELSEMFTGKAPPLPPPTKAQRIAPWFCYGCIAAVFAVAALGEHRINDMVVLGGVFAITIIMALGVLLVIPRWMRSELRQRESKARMDAGESMFPPFNASVPMPAVQPPRTP